MSRRHRARRLALQVLCCLDVQGPHGRELIDRFIDESREDQQTLRQARELIDQTLQDREHGDAILITYARNWELSRLALVDRNILRLAVAEMGCGRTPHKVVIAEALKLAQEFSTAESPRFVNGVLDAVAKGVFAGKEKADKADEETPNRKPETRNPESPEGPEQS